MSKDLPYFRFTATEWLNGDISFENYNVKGVFSDVCSFYWFKDCSITLAMLNKKFSDAQAELEALLEAGIIKQDLELDFVHINFLDEQYDLLSTKRQKNVESGRLGGLARASNAKALLKQRSSYKDKDKDKDNDKESLCPESKDSGQTQSPSTEKDPTPKRKKILLKDVKKIPLDKLEKDYDYATNLTLFLHAKLKTKYPERSSLDKANDNWIKAIDKLIRLDKKSREDVLKVIKYYLVDNNIKVWSDAFKSASFLRKSEGPGEPSYFEQMFDQMKSKKNNIPLVHKVGKYDN